MHGTKDSVKREVLDTITHIYGDIESRTRWPDILRALCGLLDAQVAVLFTSWSRTHIGQDQPLETAAIISYYGSDCCGNHMQKYAADYHHKDPLLIELTRKRKYRSGYIATLHEWVDMASFEGSEFYNDWQKVIGAPTALFACLSGTDDRQTPNAHIVFYRHLHRADFNADDVRTLQHLTPHLRQSFVLEHSMREEAEIAHAVACARGRARCGVAVLDADGNVIHLDDCLKTIIAQTDCLVHQNGRIRLNGGRSDAELRNAIKAGICPERRDELKPAGPRIVKVQGHNTTMIVQIDPFPVSRCPDRRLLGPKQPRVILRVFVENATIASGFECNIATAFGLTPSEVRFARAFTECTSVAMAACKCDIATGTARNVLKSIYRKTGATNQAALIKLLMQYA